MVKNEALDTIISDTKAGRLGRAVAHLDNYLYTFTLPQAAEQLEQIKNDYLLMTDYWQQGYDDPQRQQVYDQLLRRVYVLVTNIYIRWAIRQNTYLTGIYNRARSNRSEWSAASLKSDMEAFVADAAMLELEPEHIRAQKQKELYSSHEQLMADLFDYIWTTRLWTDSVTQAFRDMLLSPVIDTNDQQLLVSAITLSALQFFGINKFRLLIDVYMESQDEHVRQRALVGWVLCLPDDMATLYPELTDLVDRVTAEERCCNELTELQMQMIYCMQAEIDKKKIESEIMPGLMKNNNFKITRDGVQEVDEDPLDDVLRPELSEQRMEQLEASVKKMADMQKQGSDIYFGGFAQMKRFPFFSRVANWFLPFYPQHTAVSGIIGRVRGSKFLEQMVTKGPFCNSDKYSFVIAFEQTVGKLPPQMLELMDRGEAMLVGAELGQHDFNTPAHLRRAYLQDIYRFIKVHPARSNFFNPLEGGGHSRFCFFANKLFSHTPLSRHSLEVVAFLMKRGADEEAFATIRSLDEQKDNPQYYLLYATLMQRSRQSYLDSTMARRLFARCLELVPDLERAWKGYARAAFNEGDYQEALKYYDKLSDNHPDNRGYQLNKAVCLTNLSDSEAALKILYKLNYEDSDDRQVDRVMAWALTGCRRYDEALKIYDRLLKEEPPVADDLLNAAYCHWFARQVGQAVRLFSRYAKQDGIKFDAQEEFRREAAMIARHGVESIEVRLMTDLLG